jgi:toxin FitB
VIGWLLDTNVVAELISHSGVARVKAWAAAQDEHTLHLSVLTLGEYEKGIHTLPEDDPRRPVFSAALDALASRFAGRLLSVSDAAVLRWGAISGRVKRTTGHPPSVVDTLLAASAIEHDLYLATRNVRDVRHSGAAVFNLWQDDSAHALLLQPRRPRQPRPRAPGGPRARPPMPLCGYARGVVAPIGEHGPARGNPGIPG